MRSSDQVDCQVSMVSLLGVRVGDISGVNCGSGVVSFDSGVVLSMIVRRPSFI